MTNINQEYVKSQRGIIKIVQVIIGIALFSLKCLQMLGGTHACIHDGRLTFNVIVNIVFLTMNVFIFGANLLQIYETHKLEKGNSITGTVMFAMAFLLFFWVYVESTGVDEARFIFVLILVALQTGLFFMDFRALETSETIRPNKSFISEKNIVDEEA